MLHWLFVRDDRLLSCDLLARGNQRYELHLTPLSTAEAPAYEIFDRPGEAIRRHAELAFYLRESGWLLPDRQVVRPAA